MGTTFSVEEWVKADNDEGYRWRLHWDGEDFEEALRVFRLLFNEGKVMKLTGRNIDREVTL